jgi:hypothetical protein
MDAFQREDDAARWRRNNGVERVDGVLRDTCFLPHPRVGGSRGYDIPFRQMILDAYQAGNPAPEGMRTSVWRWMQNGVLPLRMTGNKPVTSLSGQYLLLLVLFKLIWPQANYYECIAFIANETDDAEIFTEKQVRTAASIEARVSAMLKLPGISSGGDFLEEAGMGVTSEEAADAVAAVDRLVRAAPDGGKLTAFPPLVRREMTAFPTTPDAGTDATR